MPDPKDELDAVFENMDTPEPPPTREVDVKRTIADALGDLVPKLNDDEARLITQAQGYINHLELAGKEIRELHALLDRFGAPRMDTNETLSLEERITYVLKSSKQRVQVDTSELEAAVERLVPVFKTARALRDLGYDGPFNGEWSAPLFNAIAEAERKGQR